MDSTDDAFPDGNEGPSAIEESPDELKARLKKEQDDSELAQRMKNLRRRMERSKREYDELDAKVNKMKRNFRRPIPKPRIAPYKPMDPPPPEVRRKKFQPPELLAENSEVN